MKINSYSYGDRLPKDWGRVRGPGGHILACARTAVAHVVAILPTRFIEDLEQNQQIAHCCRHPENHEVEAWFSSERDAELGIPDIYIFHCDQCGRQHRRFMVGGGERPFWDSR